MDFSKIGTAAAESEDQSVNNVFERELPRAGVALLRFREYIELGRHESVNPKYKPSLKAMLVFELLHPDHMVEFDGKKEPAILSIRLNKGQTSKSGFRKLFSVMNEACNNMHQHFAQMIGSAFIGTIHHNSTGEGENIKTYANLDKDGAWSLTAPEQVDAITNTATPVPIPEMHGDGKVFLWENESIAMADIEEMWNSLHIEGEREVTDKATGAITMVSKNWIQELIEKNIDWEGSMTQSFVDENIELDAPADEKDPLKELEDNAVPSM